MADTEKTYTYTCTKCGAINKLANPTCRRCGERQPQPQK